MSLNSVIAGEVGTDQVLITGLVDQRYSQSYSQIASKAYPSTDSVDMKALLAEIMALRRQDLLKDYIIQV